RILVKFSRHIPDFPIYSNGTKPGTLQVYLCNAATAAVVSGHEATWVKALKVAINVAKLHPATRAALTVGHLGAGAFVSTQC
ncbi:hypothetical protein, partial [Corynebacterium sp. MSK150]|uniref:hypothetical protein n=1 Tax=Corynebacterium sp. MSK150 TaxID=3050209 RepID=UPI00254ECB2D